MQLTSGDTHGQSETCFAANLGASQQSLWFPRYAGGNDQKENQRFLQFDKENKKMFKFSDLVSEIESLKIDQKYAALLAYYDSWLGVTPIVNKLP